MHDFFTVIILITGSVLVFVIYYLIKNIYLEKRSSLLKRNIQAKIYQDEKKYITNYLRSCVNLLESGKLQWIMIFSRLHPEHKIEIIFNYIENSLELHDRIENISEKNLQDLKDLGLTDHLKDNHLFRFRLPVNAKIVTDIIYFLFEKVHDQKSLKNLKIVTSGGVE